MNKVCKFLSVLLCVFAVSFGYAQTDDGYGQQGGACCPQPCAAQPAQTCDQPCPADHAMNDCYCLYCHYEPCYYNKTHCEYCAKNCYKKCCRYVPQYYEKQCCRYVPQYYCKTCCRQVPQYYYTCQTHYEPKYSCERCCTYKPCYYYKHVCEPTCNTDTAAPCSTGQQY